MRMIDEDEVGLKEKPEDTRWQTIQNAYHLYLCFQVQYIQQKIYTHNLNFMQIEVVKPVNRGHLLVGVNVSLHSRCPLIAGWLALLPDDAKRHHPVNSGWCLEASFGHHQIDTMVMMIHVQSIPKPPYRVFFVKVHIYISTILFSEMTILISNIIMSYIIISNIIMSYINVIF